MNVTLTDEQVVMAAQALDEAARDSRRQRVDAVSAKAFDEAAAHLADAEEHEALARMLRETRESEGG